MALTLILSLKIGNHNSDFLSIYHALFEKSESKESIIVFQMRLPRILIAALVGANLAVSGLFMQCFMKNPLADTKIMGISSGGALVVILLSFYSIPISPLIFPLFIFLGTTISGFTIYLLSVRKNFSSKNVLLAGVAISGFLHAICIGLLIFLGEDAGNILAWLAGNLSGLTWNHFWTILPWSIIGLAFSLFLARNLNVFDLGDSVSTSLGLNVSRTQFFLAIFIIILAGSTVSISGSIGFVGLIVPNIARRLIGNDYKWLIPTSALLGSLLLVISDDLARYFFQPQELPVGIFTAFIGCPYFFYLLRKEGFNASRL